MAYDIIKLDYRDWETLETFQRWIGAFGNSDTGAAWLSSARVVRCWVKSRNERNPCP